MVVSRRFAGNDIQMLDTHGVLYLGAFPFLFDVEDLPIIESHIWYRDKDGYLVSCYNYNGQRRFVRFHRIVMHAQPKQFVDHINHDRADNRKQNLRLCSRSENTRNRGLYSTNTSGIAGVFYDKQRDKWVASITYNNKKMLLGRFTDKDDAVKARLEKEVKLFKAFSPQGLLSETMGGGII